MPLFCPLQIAPELHDRSRPIAEIFPRPFNADLTHDFREAIASADNGARQFTFSHPRASVATPEEVADLHQAVIAGALVKPRKRSTTLVYQTQG